MYVCITNSDRFLAQQLIHMFVPKHLDLLFAVKKEMHPDAVHARIPVTSYITQPVEPTHRA